MWNIQNDHAYFRYYALHINILLFVLFYACTRKKYYSIIVSSILMGLVQGHLESHSVSSMTSTRDTKDTRDTRVLYTSNGRNVYMPNFSDIFRKHLGTSLIFFLSKLFNRSHNSLWVFLRLTHFHLGPYLTIENKYTLPRKCILLMHHRRHHHPGLSVSEFHDIAHAIDPDVPFHFVTGRLWGSKKDIFHRMQAAIEKKMYNALDVAECSGLPEQTDECFYRLLEPFQKNDAMVLIIFPDKFGAQFHGDRRMFYRSGAFAAAMASGIPIVDTVSMYPQFNQEHIFQMADPVYPDKWWPEPLQVLETRQANIEQFRQFRQQHKAAIQYLTDEMQKLFHERVKQLEARIATCDASVIPIDNTCSRCIYKNKQLSTDCM